ncbi:MAG TPA: DNA repair protein RadC [Vicinamibacterales bacterium]|nr:DNA repair protein RadC [Vicinamibacterales bacterium]
MKRLLPGDRPREKLLRLGASALGDNELVAVLVGVGTPRADALTIAADLLASCGGVHGLARVDGERLRCEHRLGAARAARILAAIELGRRTFAAPPGVRVQIRGPQDAAAYLLPRFGSSDVERCGLLLLDAKHRVFRTCVLTVGTGNASILEPRDVFREAARSSATAIVVFHTHPSGDPTPSADDVALTRRLRAAGELIGIDVVDHLVLGDMTYVSLKESRRL